MMCLVLWNVLWIVLNSSRTVAQSTLNQNKSVSLFEKRNTSSAETKQTIANSITVDHTTEPHRHDVETNSQTYPSFSTREDIKHREGILGSKASLPTYDLTACIENPMLPQSIRGTTGQFTLQSTNNSHFARCLIKLQVPRGKIVRLQATKCHSVNLRATDHFNISDRGVTFFRGFCKSRKQIRVLYSSTETVTIDASAHLSTTNIGERLERPLLSMCFAAINQSEKPSVEVVHLTQTFGYIQTPWWDGFTPYPERLDSCVTLDSPKGQFIFLSFINYDLRYMDSLSVVSTSCEFQREQPDITPLKVEDSIFPDSFLQDQPHRDMKLTFFFRSYSDDARLSSGFKIYFSVHSRDEMPKRVDGVHGARWNCSLSRWLLGHFPCDLTPQCADYEDEADCPYTSEKCGLDKVETGGKCYIQIYQSGGITWADSAQKCREREAKVVSLETHEEWTAVTKLLDYKYTVAVWTGLRLNQKIKEQAFFRAMYNNTWIWESGSVAYFLPMYKSGLRKDVCGVMRRKLTRTPTHTTNHCGESKPRVTVRNVAEMLTCFSSSYSESVLCEPIFSSDNHYVSKSVTIPVPTNATTSVVTSLVPCPSQHVTHELLACDEQSACRGLVDKSDQLYTASCGVHTGLVQPYFSCGTSGQYVPYSLVCDFKEDCSKKEDENFCVHFVCTPGKFSCGQGQCLDLRKLCDGFDDCLSGLDEEDCPLIVHVNYAILPPAVVNFDKPGGFSVTRLPENSSQCPETHFECFNNGYCMPVYVRCNGINDCPDHEDEALCSIYTCPGFYRCRDSERTVCVHLNNVCDGRPQCVQHDDELLCDFSCPKSCVCNGHAFTCNTVFDLRSFPQLRYLDAKGSKLQQADVSDAMMLIHLGAQACGWNNLTNFTLPNLHSLDLSDNSLRFINFENFVTLPYLRKLIVANNPLSSHFDDIQSKNKLSTLLVFDLSHVQMTYLDLGILSTVMPHLQSLDLSKNGIESLKGKQLFQRLRRLDLRGCPVFDFSPEFMKGMLNLENVFTDNFRLCCAVVLPNTFQGECQAPSDLLSSCEDLLKSNIYRIALALFALLAVLGNFFSLVYRLFFSSDRSKTGFSVFIFHLCLSDFLMGVYLAFIGVADQVFSGNYVWRETAWKQSAACSLAGVLSFLSCEVSAFIICVITLDRFLVLHFPFSQIRFGTTSAHVTCVIIWTTGLLLAGLPLLPVTSHWNFYQQTGICIPLPISSADFPGHDYSFCVMIVCNLILFILIAVGQSLIYYSVKSNAMSEWSADSKTQGGVKSKDATIARRLLAVAMSDFLCWFPIGLCGLLAAVGVTIPSEVNVAMAIFVLPLNSSLNPYLYTINTVLEKRRKAKELRIRERIQARLKMT